MYTISFLLTVAFVSQSYATDQLSVCVTASNLNFRTCGSSSCSVVGTQPQGSCFDFIENSGAWVKVQYSQSQTAYAHGNYLTDTIGQQCVQVTASNLNIRECRSTSCDILGVAPNGMTLKFKESVGGWDNVILNNKLGFGAGSYLTAPAPCNDQVLGSQVLCSGNTNNEIRGSDAHGEGHYGASRAGGTRRHKGVDVICRLNNIIYAPFGGILTPSRPYREAKCCNNGFRITGTGEWAGYVVKVWYNKPYSSKIGKAVSKGEAVATHLSLLCRGCLRNPAGMTDHAHLQIEKNGVTIDPTPYL